MTDSTMIAAAPASCPWVRFAVTPPALRLSPALAGLVAPDQAVADIPEPLHAR